MEKCTSAWGLDLSQCFGFMLCSIPGRSVAASRARSMHSREIGVAYPILFLQLGPTYAPSDSGGWWEVLMDQKKCDEIFAQLPQPPDGAAFEIEKVTTISIPHPYCITPRHVAYAADNCSGRLNESAIEGAEKRGARCGVRGCQLPYSRHESQVTLIVVVPVGTRDLNAVPGLHSYLLGVKVQAEELGVTGFAFQNRRGQL